MEDTKYLKKYLKYKRKYLELLNEDKIKKQKGGGVEYDIRFYDNDIGHINSVKSLFPNINSIHVPETNNINRNGNIADKIKYSEYLKLSKNFNLKNKYLSFMSDKNEEFISEGITHEQINDLNIWSNQQNNKKKVVLFDWDRTLSHVEGLYIDPYNPIDSNDILKYCMGDRYDKVTKLFNNLKKNNVDTYIITNNSLCGNNIDSNQFFDIFKNLKINKSNVLCSRTFNNKGLYLKNNYNKLFPNA